MADITIQPVTDKATWEAFIATHPEANFLQSWLWGDFNEVMGRTVYRQGLYDGQNLQGVMLSIVEPARRARYLTVPAGPILDWSNKTLVDAAVAEMQRQGHATKCAFVRVRPQITETPANAELFKKRGFRPAKMHLHAELTSQLDITADENTLLNNFRKNTRYELKQAKKRGIKVTTTTDPEAIDEFYNLQLQTAQRHGFVPYGKKFLKEQFRLFAGAGQALLYRAETSQGELVAEAYVIFYNQEAAYHYGASTELGRREPGAYLIQWEAIKEAKRRGLSRYNFWGVVMPEQTTHRFYGVSVFKRGFKGEDVEYLHARDLVINWTKYLPNLAIETARKRRRHL
ncbi:MAG TPA: peptidoglycan bridge formation glycyltransferase FemA/FemB family protein [Patescibacteria group bacterium]|nr:peptidoglycan bridge formation glycyltransferase FemA/FemB family protein [Patescibacteria group bacterium]